LQCAVGATEQMTTLHLGHVLTTADPEMLKAYQNIDWAKGYHRGETVSVRQVPLESILRDEGLPAGFDLLVVDVEGNEDGVFSSFDLALWRPKMIIAELEDQHPSFERFAALTARASRLRGRIVAHGYAPIYRDIVDTIFWHGR
jgi:hypothetical protein